MFRSGSSARVVVPIVAGLGCLIVAGFCGPILAWILIILAFGLVLDGATLAFSRGGGLKDFQQ